MGVRDMQCFLLLLGLLLCSGELEYSQFDVVVPVINPTTPTSTFPTINPTTPAYPIYNPTTPTSPTYNPTTPATTYPPFNPIPTPPNQMMTPPMTNPYTTPTTAGPASSGQSWCVASQSASQTALQVALDYACGFGGADCSEIQTGGSCYNPNTLRDHASYAFNNYYQKNPTPTSCDFGGTAVIINIDPSTTTCQFPSSSTSSSVLNTTNPTGSTVFGGGSLPPDTSGTTASMTIRMPLFFTLTCLLRSLYSLNLNK